jgi:hypothetical protein
MYSIVDFVTPNLIIKVEGIENNKSIDINKFNDYRKVNNHHYLDTSNNDIVLIECLKTIIVYDNIVFRRANQFEFDRWQFEKRIGSNGLENQENLSDNALVYKELMGIN